MWKFKSHRLAAAFGIAGVGLAAAMGAYAQEGGGDSNWSYWLGRSKASGPTCPQIEWSVIPVPRGVAGQVRGVAFYSDMSGISRLQGMVTSDGKINSTLTSVSGNGPVGTITGLRAPDATHIELHGAGCANANFTLLRWGKTSEGNPG